MTVLDASAVLALLQDERGADMVETRLDGALLSAVNLGEVVGKLVDANVEPRGLRSLLTAAGVVIEPFTAADAEVAGALRGVRGGKGLSLGDRCCLAVGLREDGQEILTADRAWTRLDLPAVITLIR